MNQNNARNFNFKNEISDADRFVFERFKLRFEELWLNWEDLKESGINLSGHFKLRNDGRVHGNNELGVSRFRLKGLFLDYRHFSGQKEPVEFNRVCNLLKRYFDDELAHSIIDQEKNGWKSVGAISNWHSGFTTDEFIRAEINENYFHSEMNGKGSIKLAEVKEKISEDARLYEMTSIVYDRLLCIQNLCSFMVPIYSGVNALSVPMRHPLLIK